MNTYEELAARIMERAADLPVREALERGMVTKCPACRILHAGIRFSHPDHQDYCSTYCFRNRKDFQ